MACGRFRVQIGTTAAYLVLYRATVLHTQAAMVTLSISINSAGCQVDVSSLSTVGALLTAVEIIMLGVSCDADPCPSHYCVLKTAEVAGNETAVSEHPASMPTHLAGLRTQYCFAFLCP